MFMAPDTVTSADVGTAHRRRLVLCLLLSLSLVALDSTAVATTLPQLARELGGNIDVAWVFASYLLAQTVVTPLAGRAADIYGRRMVLNSGLALFVTGSLGAGLAPSMAFLVGCRVVQGVGAAALVTTVNTLIGDLYPMSERGRIQGWVATVWAVTSISGPAIGGLIAELATWRLIFLINIPVGCTAIWSAIFDLRGHDARQNTSRVDYCGAVLLIAASGLLNFWLLQEGEAWGWVSARSAFLVGSVVLTVLVLIPVELRRSDPLLQMRLWATRAVSVPLVLSGVAGVIYIALAAFLPTWSAHTAMRASPIEAGGLLASTGLSWSAASAMASSVYRMAGHRRTVLAGAALTLAATVALVQLRNTSTIFPVLVTCAVLGAGLGLLNTTLLVALQSVTQRHVRGGLTGTLLFSRYLGQTVGAALAGAVGLPAGGMLSSGPQRATPGSAQLVNGSSAVGSLIEASASDAALRLFLAVSCAAAVMLLIGIFMTEPSQERDATAGRASPPQNGRGKP